MSLLLLGGTGDAMQLARTLHARGVDVVYSVAGLVRQPQLDCRVVSGGFSQFGGLRDFIERERIGAILDATHPYASAISANASDAARQMAIPLWRYRRPPWQAQAGDDWREFDDWMALPALLASFRCVFFSAGRLPPEFVDRLAAAVANAGQRQLLRSAVVPRFELPASMSWIEDIGPFTLDAERALFRRHGVDALVSKNSGGDATAAKLAVARELGIPVFMLRRPVSAAGHEFADLDACADFVAERCLESA